MFYHRQYSVLFSKYISSSFSAKYKSSVSPSFMGVTSLFSNIFLKIFRLFHVELSLIIEDWDKLIPLIKQVLNK